LSVVLSTEQGRKLHTLNTRERKKDRPMMWGYGFNWGGMFLMMLGMAIWIALLVVLVWAGIRWFEKKTSLPGPRDTGFPTSGPTAMEILRQRYAWNEIDAAPLSRCTSDWKRPPAVRCSQRIARGSHGAN
jgi:uncharacterized membrane protein